MKYAKVQSTEQLPRWGGGGIKEISTYYHMLREYLSIYKDTYPTTTTIIQADRNDCFYRTFISIPHAVEVFL